jgi:protein-tyrosine-phosphatase
MGAILASFTPNEAVIRAQANAIAAPEIARINEIGRQAAQQADAIHAAEDAHNRSVEQRWDAQDRQNQAFSNYLLDQTVIQDNVKGTHSTEWNQTADALVKSNPQRYEYVDTPNFWKGVDY